MQLVLRYECILQRAHAVFAVCAGSMVSSTDTSSKHEARSYDTSFVNDDC